MSLTLSNEEVDILSTEICSHLHLDFGRGGMTGLLGDLRGLKEGFMVVFVASERQKMENNFEDKLPVLPPAEEAL